MQRANLEYFLLSKIGILNLQGCKFEIIKKFILVSHFLLFLELIQLLFNFTKKLNNIQVISKNNKKTKNE